MKKSNLVNEDEQTIRSLRGCLLDMWGTREIRHSVETGEPESERDLFADLRNILDKSVVFEGGKPYRGEK